MKKRPLGRTGVEVSELSLGAMTFGGSGAAWEAIGAVDQSTASELVARALDAGIDFFDTADLYGNGESETMLGKALGSRKRDVLIATKVGFPAGEGPRERLLTRAHVHAACDGSLRRLGVETIDVYFVHRFEPRTPLEETMRALEDLVRTGKVRYLGLSNFAGWQIAKANGLAALNGWARFDVAQMNYNLLARELERDVLPCLADQRMGLMVWSPLASGVLTGKYGKQGEAPPGARRAGFDVGPIDWNRAQRILDAMKGVATAHSATHAQVALAWLLAQPGVTTILVGAKKLHQLEDNLAAVGLALSAGELAALDAASALADEYPGWFQRQFNLI